MLRAIACIERFAPTPVMTVSLLVALGSSTHVSLAGTPLPEQARAVIVAQSTRDVIDRFNDAVNRHDLDAVSQMLSDDTVFEDTSPAPDGKRYDGKAAVVGFWQTWFARNAGARFDAEEVIVSGDRAVVRWVYRKMRDGQPWHLRGVDVFVVRAGKVAAKLAYVKG